MVSNRARCPGCGDWVTFPQDAIEGERIRCSACDQNLEIINLTPPELDYADWEDEDEDSDED